MSVLDKIGEYLKDKNIDEMDANHEDYYQMSELKKLKSLLKKYKIENNVNKLREVEKKIKKLQNQML
jgi:hypothetical protein